jgi:Ni,Fe-hydrogenase III component G
MRAEEKIIQIINQFGEYILSSFSINGNEYYIEIDPKMIADVSQYINKVLECPLVSMFASDERELSGKFIIHYALADTIAGRLIVLKTSHSPENMTFRSICSQVPAAALYEREIRDMFGLVPMGHPDPSRLVFHSNWPEGLSPLKKDFDASVKPERANVEIPFKKVNGEGVFEVPVGPVHAGIIEPGHFRFSVAGEPIINLQAQLYFVHKGIEKMCEGASIEKCLFISERIS